MQEPVRYIFLGNITESAKLTRLAQSLMNNFRQLMIFQGLSQNVRRFRFIDGTEIVCESRFGQNSITINTVSQISYKKEEEENLLVPLEGLVEFNAVDAYMVYKTAVYPMSSVPVSVLIKLNSFTPISGLVSDTEDRLGSGETASYIAALTSYTWVIKDEDDITNSDKSIAVCRLLFFPEPISDALHYIASAVYIYNSRLPGQDILQLGSGYNRGLATNYYLHSDGNISIIRIRMGWSESNNKYVFTLNILKVDVNGTTLSNASYEATPMIASPTYFETNGIAGATVAYDGVNVYTNLDFVEFPYAHMVVDATKRYDYNPITGEIVTLSRELSLQQGSSWTLGPQKYQARDFHILIGGVPGWDEYYHKSYEGPSDPPDEHHFCVTAPVNTELLEADSSWTYENCLFTITKRIHSKVYDSQGVLTELDLDISEMWSGELCHIELTSSGWKSWTSHEYLEEAFDPPEIELHWIYEPNDPTDASLLETTATRSGKEFINYLPYMIVYFDYTQNKWVWYDFLSYYNLYMPENPEDPIHYSRTKCIYDNTGTVVAEHTQVLV